ncbi:MAG: hypothetical protein ACHQQQ_01310 [Bacteroidota bacterium]
MKRRIIVKSPENLDRIIRVLTEVPVVYDHMDRTFLVMLDRSMFFQPSFEALKANKMSALTTQEPKLKGQEESLLEPLTFAFGYAQKVFLCTAVEVCLLHHYTNSAYFFVSYFKGDFDRLPTLKHWVQSRRDSRDWDNWKNFNSDKQLKTMKEISFSNLSVANEFFGDIYGKLPFQQALSDNDYKTFFKIFQSLQEQRNGIIHRGGELKDGLCIEVSSTDMSETYETAKYFRNHLLGFSAWCRDWWLKKFYTKLEEYDTKQAK